MATQTIFRQIELAGIKFAETELEMRKSAIIADLQSGGAKAIDFMAVEIAAVIGKQGGILGKLSAGALDSLVREIAKRAVTGLGGEAEALYALVDAELHSIAKSLGGT